MLLYHGTAERHLEKIMTEGLRPRGNRVGNWVHSVESNPNAIYLTNAYALHFAVAAAGNADGKFVVLEIDTDHLDESDLTPDEDFLEQVSRNDTNFPCHGWSMPRRTRWFRAHMRNFNSHWETSLQRLGNAAYFGNIPPEAITRVALVERKPIHPIVFMSDPTISLMNYHLMGGYYRGLTAILFGDEPEPNADPFHRLDDVKKISRDGIFIVDNRRPNR